MARSVRRGSRAMAVALLLAAVGTTGCDDGSPGAASTATPSTTRATTPAVDGSDALTPAPGTTDPDTQRHPDVVAVEVSPGSEPGTWDVAATLSSPYDTPERYADAFRVLAEDGTELGVRELLHDHANEQPFTRSLVGLAVPADVDRITVEGRDLQYGWGGATTTIDLPR